MTKFGGFMSAAGELEQEMNHTAQSQNSKNRSKRPSNDSDLDDDLENYEKDRRATRPEWALDQSNRLPVKLADGTFALPEARQVNLNKGDIDDSVHERPRYVKGDAKADKKSESKRGRKNDLESEEERPLDESQKKRKQPKKVEEEPHIMYSELMTRPKAFILARRQELKLKIAEYAEKIIAAPEKNISASKNSTTWDDDGPFSKKKGGNARKQWIEKHKSAASKQNTLLLLHNLCMDPDPVIRRMAILSECAVFKDIIPGYRIRLTSEKEADVKLKKEVKRLREFEASLLRAYQRYLEYLEFVVKSGEFSAVRSAGSRAQASAYRNSRQSEGPVFQKDSENDALSAYLAEKKKKYGPNGKIADSDSDSGSSDAHSDEDLPPEVEAAGGRAHIPQHEYQRLQLQEKRRRAANRMAFDGPDSLLYSLSQTAFQSLCLLLSSSPHFNFRSNLLAFVIPRLSSPDINFAGSAEQSLRELFREDTTFEASAEAVRLLDGALQASVQRAEAALLHVAAAVAPLHATARVLDGLRLDLANSSNSANSSADDESFSGLSVTIASVPARPGQQASSAKHNEATIAQAVRELRRLPVPSIQARALRVLQALPLGVLTRIDSREEGRRLDRFRDSTFLGSDGGSGKNLKNSANRKRKHGNVDKGAEADIEAGLRLADAEELDARRKHARSALKSVISIYFRILRAPTHASLLSPVLEGLSKFVHLIDVGVVADLLRALRALLPRVLSRSRLELLQPLVSPFSGQVFDDQFSQDSALERASTGTSAVLERLADLYLAQTTIGACLNSVLSALRILGRVDSVLEADETAFSRFLFAILQLLAAPEGFPRYDAAAIAQSSASSPDLSTEDGVDDLALCDIPLDSVNPDHCVDAEQHVLSAIFCVQALLLSRTCLSNERLKGFLSRILNLALNSPSLASTLSLLALARALLAKYPALHTQAFPVLLKSSSAAAALKNSSNSSNITPASVMAYAVSVGASVMIPGASGPSLASSSSSSSISAADKFIHFTPGSLYDCDRAPIQYVVSPNPVVVSYAVSALLCHWHPLVRAQTRLLVDAVPVGPTDNPLVVFKDHYSTSVGAEFHPQIPTPATHPLAAKLARIERASSMMEEEAQQSKNAKKAKKLEGKNVYIRPADISKDFQEFMNICDDIYGINCKIPDELDDIEWENEFAIRKIRELQKARILSRNIEKLRADFEAQKR